MSVQKSKTSSCKWKTKQKYSHKQSVKTGGQSGEKTSTCKSKKKDNEEEEDGEKLMSKEKELSSAKEESSKVQTNKKAATPPLSSQYQVPILSKVTNSVSPATQLHDPKAVMTTALSEEEREKKIEKNRQAVESIISMLQSIPPDNISTETRDDLIVIYSIAKGIMARYVPVDAIENSDGKKSSKEDFNLDEVKSGDGSAE